MSFAAPNIIRDLSDNIATLLSMYRLPPHEGATAESAKTEDAKTEDATPEEEKEPPPVPQLPGTPRDTLPARVVRLLCQRWEDVTAGASYAKREWQTSAYRHQPPLPSRQGSLLVPPDQDAKAASAAASKDETSESERRASTTTVKKAKIKIPATTQPIKPRALSEFLFFPRFFLKNLLSEASRSVLKKCRLAANRRKIHEAGIFPALDMRCSPRNSRPRRLFSKLLPVQVVRF